jgi:hypothetical protein
MLASASNDHTAQFWARSKPGETYNESLTQAITASKAAITAQNAGIPSNY